MAKQRLDQAMVDKKMISTRSQAESYIKLGQVEVNHKVVTKPGFLVDDNDEIKLMAHEQYVSRAGLKLASVASILKLDFKEKIVLDVGSSTGGFTDYALQHGAKKVIAVDVGSGQLHPSLRTNPHVEQHEKTDIRQFAKLYPFSDDRQRRGTIDIVLIDVSFISLREVLPAIKQICGKNCMVVAMAKPQFEAGDSHKHKGVIKNDKMRRNILKELENWIQNLFIIAGKADSGVAGAKGNRERFYLLKAKI